MSKVTIYSYIQSLLLIQKVLTLNLPKRETCCLRSRNCIKSGSDPFIFTWIPLEAPSHCIFPEMQHMYKLVLKWLVVLQLSPTIGSAIVDCFSFCGRLHLKPHNIIRCSNIFNYSKYAFVEQRGKGIHALQGVLNFTHAYLQTAHGWQNKKTGLHYKWASTPCMITLKMWSAEVCLQE
jgi:hypothetical protein